MSFVVLGLLCSRSWQEAGKVSDLCKQPQFIPILPLTGPVGLAFKSRSGGPHGLGSLPEHHVLVPPGLL